MLLLLLLSTTAFVSAAPYGNDPSVSFLDPSFDRALERIVTEEAEKINRTADEHAAYCVVRLPWQLRFLITEEEELALRTEIAFFAPDNLRQHPIHYENEVLPYFREKTPHMYSAFMKFRHYFGKKMHELNVEQETVDFMNTLEREVLLWTIYASNTSHDLTSKQEYAVVQYLWKDAIKTAISGYKALTEEGKNDVEKMWCVRTVYRVIEATGNIGKIEEFLKSAYARKR